MNTRTNRLKMITSLDNGSNLSFVQLGSGEFDWPGIFGELAPLTTNPQPAHNAGAEGKSNPQPKRISSAFPTGAPTRKRTLKKKTYPKRSPSRKKI